MATSTIVLAVLGLCLTGCSAARPFVREGDGKSVDIGYSDDVASTLPLARRHCAEFDRVPRLRDASPDTAYFDCLPR